MESGKCLFIQKEATIIFKIVGALRFDASGGLSSKIETIKSLENIEEIIMDMSEATFVDSTVLGLIAQLAKWGLVKNIKPIIIYKNENINKMLRHVGLHKIFFVCEKDNHLKPSMLFEELSSGPESEEQIRSRIENAHKLLCEIDEKNKTEFGDVVKCLFKRNDC